MLRRASLLFGVALFAFPTLAHAYVDPASGSLILQVISAFVLASMLSFRRARLWLGDRFRSLRNRVRKI